MALPEFYVDGHGGKRIDEPNHFLIQSVRIPRADPPSLRKIIQVGLNVGQYRGTRGANNAAGLRGVGAFLEPKDRRVLLADILPPDQIRALATLLK
jgi:hypothetical protein